MNGLLLVARAYGFASRRHAGQSRKGPHGAPFIDHLVEVAELVAVASGGQDPALVAAAVLHDVVEDTPTSRDELARSFGEDVAALVMACTDDERLPKAERRRLQVVHAPSLPARAKVIKLGDKTSNLRALPKQPAEAWPEDRRLGYVAWAREVVRALGEVHAGLAAEFEQAAEAAERHFRAAGLS
jgi:(p)ppGpp synthase/HD superfamily hydrolase